MFTVQFDVEQQKRPILVFADDVGVVDSDNCFPPFISFAHK